MGCAVWGGREGFPVGWHPDPVSLQAADARLKEVQETAASGGARMAAVESRCEVWWRRCLPVGLV